MAQENIQKIKLLRLMELLRQDSDEEHPLKTSEICARLGKMNITCDRRTLSRDIALLNEQGYEVLSRLVGHEKGYYILDRGFSVPELKILIDAVQASKFITSKKTAELVDKIARLAGSHYAEILKGNMVCFATIKHSNESVYYNIGFLEEALQGESKASFLYFDLDEKLQRIYRKNKERYVVEPVALVYSEDYYYLVCYNQKHNDICSYRVDRMESVQTENDPVRQRAVIKRDDIAHYTAMAFKMFSGRREDVVLQFDRSLIGVIYDKFGEGIKMTRVGDDEYIADVTVLLSPVFWGWVFQYGGRMKILSPEPIISEYRQRAAALAAGCLE